MAPASSFPKPPNGRFRAAFERAPLTNALILTNGLIFLVSLALSFTWGSPSLFSLGARAMLKMGANDSTMTIAEMRFETLVTACFLHFSALHLMFNMMALYQAGTLVEVAVGPARFFPMYLIAGIAGSITSAFVGWMTGERVSGGASGAICGVIGAALVLGIRVQGWKGPLTGAMGRWLGTILLIGALPGFDNAAHLGGTLGGIAMATTWRKGATYSKERSRITLVASTIIVVGAFVALFFRERIDPYIALPAEERARIAQKAYDAGDCVVANEAIERALALAPKSSPLQMTQAAIRARCGNINDFQERSSPLR